MFNVKSIYGKHRFGNSPTLPRLITDKPPWLELTDNPLSVWLGTPAATWSRRLAPRLQNVDAGPGHGADLVDLGALATDDGADGLVGHKHLESDLPVSSVPVGKKDQKVSTDIICVAEPKPFSGLKTEPRSERAAPAQAVNLVN